MKQPFIILEHTADIGIEAFGKTKEELFINAGRGMFSLMFVHHEPSRRMLTKQITFKGTNDNELLVDWLQELLYYTTVRHLLPSIYESIILQENSGTASIQTVPLPIQTTTFKQEIKGVTYHQIDIQHKNGVFSTKIFFDV